MGSLLVFIDSPCSGSFHDDRFTSQHPLNNAPGTHLCVLFPPVIDSESSVCIKVKHRKYIQLCGLALITQTLTQGKTPDHNLGNIDLDC